MNELGGSNKRLFAGYQPPFETKGKISYPIKVPAPNSSLTTATAIKIML